MEQGDRSSGRLPWHIRRTGFPPCWRLSRWRPSGQFPVRVGILDSGVDLKHPALRGLLGTGVNLLKPGEPPTDENGHGTHIAGIIASASGCLQSGDRPAEILIHPIKLFDRTGFGRIEDIVNGLQWCVDHGIQVINMSFGTDFRTSRNLERAVAEAGEHILLVGAAGNDGHRGAVDFPGRYPDVLAVTGSTRHDRLAPFSSIGPEVDLIAPGCSILSPAPGGGYVRMSGTSVAAPHVTAAAALLLGLEPGLSPSAIRQRMKETAEWLPRVPGQAQGAGLLRADRLLRRLPF